MRVETGQDLNAFTPHLLACLCARRTTDLPSWRAAMKVL